MQNVSYVETCANNTGTLECKVHMKDGLLGQKEENERQLNMEQQGRRPEQDPLV